MTMVPPLAGYRIRLTAHSIFILKTATATSFVPHSSDEKKVIANEVKQLSDLSALVVILILTRDSFRGRGQGDETGRHIKEKGL